MAISDDLLTQVFAAGEVGVTALGFGYLHGREGTMPQVAGIDADLLAALGFHAVGFVGKKWLGKAAQHSHNIGNGALAYLLGYKGAKMGQDDFKKKGQLFGDKKGVVPTAPRTGTDKSVLLSGWDYRGIGAGPIQQAQAAAARASSPTAAYGY
jgi:hypothetical protein